jgi:magnesium chelatase subunit D
MTIYPFTAIVGQERMKRALILNAINHRIGGVLIRGERGTAKSTAARALAALLPQIDVVADCPFNCDPTGLEPVCDNCRERLERGEVLPAARCRTRFVDLPVSATEDRVVGTLDLEQAIQKGERHFEPGVLATANRGLLYVDEVNLLDDHVVDLLLDSAAMGVNVVEREGISFSHPARFILVGTMNPEEGDLRPQLLDRFALCVDIRGILDAGQRVQILERHVQFERDPEAFWTEWEPNEQRLSEEIARARDRLPLVTHTQRDLYTIAQLTAEFHVDGHRADLVILKAARAHAAFEGHLQISARDILLATELALPHRLKRQPFEEKSLDSAQIEERLTKVQKDLSPPDGVPEGTVSLASQSLDPTKKDGEAGEVPGDMMAAPPLNDTSPSTPAGPQQKIPQRPVAVGRIFQPRRLDTPLDRLTRKQPGRRSTTRSDRKRGRYIRSRPANGETSDIAFDATFREAAPHQLERSRYDDNGGSGVALHVTVDDLQRKVRIRRTANLVLFVVDASWSMAAAERMEATKGAILSLLVDAYQRRDQVGLVVFQKNEARIALPPTSSVELAQKMLSDIPVGGKTPLSGGLLLAYRVCTAARRRDPEVRPLIIVLTDGAGNVSLTELPAQEEARRVADLIRQSGFRSVVVDMEHPAFDRGLSRDLAEALGGPCYRLPELQSEALLHTVRGEMEN